MPQPGGHWDYIMDIVDLGRTNSDWYSILSPLGGKRNREALTFYTAFQDGRNGEY